MPTAPTSPTPCPHDNLYGRPCCGTLNDAGDTCGACGRNPTDYAPVAARDTRTWFGRTFGGATSDPIIVELMLNAKFVTESVRNSLDIEARREHWLDKPTNTFVWEDGVSEAHVAARISGMTFRWSRTSPSTSAGWSTPLTGPALNTGVLLETRGLALHRYVSNLHIARTTLRYLDLHGAPAAGEPADFKRWKALLDEDAPRADSDPYRADAERHLHDLNIELDDDTFPPCRDHTDWLVARLATRNLIVEAIVNAAAAPAGDSVVEDLRSQVARLTAQVAELGPWLHHAACGVAQWDTPTGVLADGHTTVSKADAYDLLDRRAAGEFGPV